MATPSPGSTARFSRWMVFPTVITLSVLLVVPVLLAIYLSLTKDTLVEVLVS